MNAWSVQAWSVLLVNVERIHTWLLGDSIRSWGNCQNPKKGSRCVAEWRENNSTGRPPKKTGGHRELDELHREVHASIAARMQRRDLLEVERRKIAEERARAPVVAEAVRFGAGLIVCLTPLVVVVYLLRCLGSAEGVDAATFEVLVDELVTNQRRLLLAQPRQAIATESGTAPT